MQSHVRYKIWKQILIHHQLLLVKKTIDEKKWLTSKQTEIKCKTIYQNFAIFALLKENLILRKSWRMSVPISSRILSHNKYSITGFDFTHKISELKLLFIIYKISFVTRGVSGWLLYFQIAVPKATWNEIENGATTFITLQLNAKQPPRSSL